MPSLTLPGLCRPKPETTSASADALLLMAGELMAEVGYGAMSMRQLAARVGVQAGSLYHHVASKQDLLLDVLLAVVAQRQDAWQRSRYSRSLQGYLRFMLARQRSHPAEELLLRHESRHLQPQQRPWLNEALERLHRPLRQVIEKAHLGTQDAGCVTQAILSLLDTADGLRHREPQMPDSWIEAWVVGMSHAMLHAQAPRPLPA